VHDVGDSGGIVLRGLNDEVGVGIHYAVAVELEAMLLPVMGKNAEERFEVLWGPEQRLLRVASEDDVVDGGRGC
jgi:hypothetical protein